MVGYAVAVRGNGCDEGKAPLVDKAALLKDLQKQVGILEDDLRGRTDSVEEFRTALRSEYESAYGAQRTAATYETWRDERVTQVAAAWVLACVFVRFCEDNGLVPDAWLSGPGERLAEAEDRHAEYFRAHPERNDRDWLTASFEALAESNPTVAGLFDREHNPLWELTPGYEMASGLLAFWRERGADGEIRYDFTDAELDTRFLGDLYQDLSEHARKTYALLQTPEFVEEFILDLTLEPAVEEFGLDPVWKHKPAGWTGEDAVARGLRCIDPACGSGHFLLGMFERLLAKWREAEPGTNDWVLVRRALDSVHGADKNPFAAAIARFRLLVAALKACGVRELRKAPELPIHVAVGDSLLHGRDAGRADDVLPELMLGDEPEGPFLYRTEDVAEFAERVDLLGRGSYHVVVANPPYITVKDKQENENYRDIYFACAGKYALSVPFAQRIFELAVRAGGDERNGGFTGQITSNSFMKREFGKVLIESFFQGGEYKDPQTKRKRHFAGVELSHVIDTSGAYIPGHGTPTVILVGRNQVARQAQPIRVVLGVRGEPSQPMDPSTGLVWSAIARQVGKSASESAWVSTEDAARDRFREYPWSLSGGGAGDVFERLSRARRPLSDLADGSIGVQAILGNNDVYLAERRPATWARNDIPSRVFVAGDNVRDWGASSNWAAWPYLDERPLHRLEAHDPFWSYRTDLRAGLVFGKSREQRGMAWLEYAMLSWGRTRAERLISFACVATHNHFYLASGGIHNQHAPVIKLPNGATEEQYLELLGVLNSSTACFWLKQVCHDKGSQSGTGGFMHDEWERFFEFTGTKLQEFPLPIQLPLPYGRGLDLLAQKLMACEPASAMKSGRLTRPQLDESRDEHALLRARMIALQEELDWTVYGSYSLLGADEIARSVVPDQADVPGVALGERAFEIVLARRVADGDAETVWFDRHGATPVTEIPGHWPAAYKAVVQARIDLIESRKDIALIERPECKRRWSSESWEKKENAALRTWILDACEREDLWFGSRDGFRQPRTLTVSQLADALRNDEDVQAVAALYAADHLGKRDASLATVLADVIAAEHVPYIAALRYKDSGLRKRAQWEKTWDLQREEDRTGQRLDIAVPPKYSSADFLKQSYWSHRGKLDVPKERFISYPDAGPDSDPTILLGWAGWDHKNQAQALINLVNDRTDESGWETARISPLLAGLQEVMPWVHQWHGEFDEEWDGTPSEEYQAYLDEQRAKHGLSADDLTAWRPEKKARGGRKKAE